MALSRQDVFLGDDQGRQTRSDVSVGPAFSYVPGAHTGRTVWHWLLACDVDAWKVDPCTQLTHVRSAWLEGGVPSRSPAPHRLTVLHLLWLLWSW